jgi:tRNA pseudouridine55 synthase
VERKKRKVEIKDIKLIDISQPYVKFRISCSKGTYVRSLAHDWGEKLGCGAHLFSLQRTGVGPFKLQDGFTLEDMWHVQNEGRLSDILVPIEKALAHLPSVVVKEGFAEKVRHGLPLVSSSVKSTERDFDQNQTISIKDQGKNIIAIGRALSSSKKFLDSDHKDKLFAYVRVI